MRVTLGDLTTTLLLEQGVPRHSATGEHTPIRKRVSTLAVGLQRHPSPSARNDRRRRYCKAEVASVSPTVRVLYVQTGPVRPALNASSMSCLHAGAQRLC